ncbi:helix-turn-helix domain-containing protein [Sulfurivirga sp.]|uniref:helix-turn-helix domain-containing protein n=1 Tax=Sulfurivirga sp. TaxID=2614236 RepID=UPI0025FAC82C|nr:helix-turn-helix domain-containing protein [Sulfurivirga sp.]
MEESKADIIAAAIGLKATLKLCAHFGGKTLYVPTRIEANHPIALLIGPEKAARLAGAIGGEEVTLPVVDMGTERRAARVIRFLVHGLRPREIAALENISERTVTRIAERHRELIDHLKSSLRWQALLDMPVRKV